MLVLFCIRSVKIHINLHLASNVRVKVTMTTYNVTRILKACSDSSPVIDVDGSHLH